MKIASFTSRIPTMGLTKTNEDWKKYLGEKPNRLGVIARLYKNNTLSYIVDGFRNVYLKNEKSNGFLLSNSLLIEWMVNFAV